MNGEYISYINERKVSLRYLNEDVGELLINNERVGKCPYSYTKNAIRKIERQKLRGKVYIQDEQILFRELRIGTLIDSKI